MEEEAFRTVEAVEDSHAHLVVVQVLLAHHIHLNWEEDLQIQVFHIILILDSVLVKRGSPEYPGQNPKDMAVYKNNVRYKIGQEVGGYQTWEHMLDM